MKTRVSLIICVVFCSIICLTGCKKQPTACIDASATASYTGDVVSFSSCSVDAYYYEWTFPDGDIVTTKDVNYTFNVPGAKTVQLKAYSKKYKKVDTESVTINVTQSTGQASFWQSGSPGYDVTEVTVNGITKSITLDSPTGISGCSTSGCANFTLDVGSYSFYAEEVSFPYTYWSGTVSVTKDGCKTMQLL